jgi:hypothetical protein
LFHPASVHGVLPFRGLSLPRSRLCLVGKGPALMAFSPTATDGHDSVGPGRPRHAQLASRRSLSRLQGLQPPGSPFRACHRLDSTPADPLLGFSLPRVSPLPVDGTDFRRSSLRALRQPPLPKLPSGPETGCASRYHSPGPVALPLSRPPLPFKVPRTRATCPFEQNPVRAFCSPRAPGGVAAPCGPSLDRRAARPEWNKLSGSAKL